MIHVINTNKTIDVSNGEIRSLYSTIKKCLEYYESNIEKALSFLEKGRCSSENSIETARQFNLIRDKLSSCELSEIQFNEYFTKPNSISPIITSCSNFYTTNDGDDLLFEITRILTYAAYTGNEAIIEE